MTMNSYYLSVAHEHEQLFLFSKHEQEQLLLLSNT